MARRLRGQIFWISEPVTEQSFLILYVESYRVMLLAQYAICKTAAFVLRHEFTTACRVSCVDFQPLRGFCKI